MHFVKSSGNKLLFISRSIFILGTVANQADFSLIDPNNANVSESSRENAIAINSTIRNKRAEELKKDIKIGLKV